MKTQKMNMKKNITISSVSSNKNSIQHYWVCVIMKLSVGSTLDGFSNKNSINCVNLSNTSAHQSYEPIWSGSATAEH